jgi:hypothetical protein
MARRGIHGPTPGTPGRPEAHAHPHTQAATTTHQHRHPHADSAHARTQTDTRWGNLQPALPETPCRGIHAPTHARSRTHASAPPIGVERRHIGGGGAVPPSRRGEQPPPRQQLPPRQQQPPCHNTQRTRGIHGPTPGTPGRPEAHAHPRTQAATTTHQHRHPHADYAHARTQTDTRRGNLQPALPETPCRGIHAPTHAHSRTHASAPPIGVERRHIGGGGRAANRRAAQQT